MPGLDFSFSGLKTALLYAVRDLTEEELAARRSDLAASYQQAIVRALVERVREAAEQTARQQVAIVGGVAGGMTDEADSFIKAVMADMMDGYQRVPGEE